MLTFFFDSGGLTDCKTIRLRRLHFSSSYGRSIACLDEQSWPAQPRVVDSEWFGAAAQLTYTKAS